MRKNHHGKKDRLVKRVFALCLALAVICTCLVPVFATEGLIDPQVNQEASRPVDDGEASYPDDEFAGFGEEEATRPVDGGEAAGFGEDEVATRPVEGGEDNLDGGPNVKETEWGTVIEYDTSTSTDPSSSTETQSLASRPMGSPFHCRKPPFHTASRFPLGARVRLGIW